MMWNLVAIFFILLTPFVLSGLLPNLWVATFVSAAALTAIVHITSYFGAGYVDPFFVISIPIVLCAFLIWSIATIWIFRHLRARRRSK
jgi:hypothetical protein